MNAAVQHFHIMRHFSPRWKSFILLYLLIHVGLRGRQIHVDPDIYGYYLS